VDQREKIRYPFHIFYSHKVGTPIQLHSRGARFVDAIIIDIGILLRPKSLVLAPAIMDWRQDKS
jgi:hypothetical protein